MDNKYYDFDSKGFLATLGVSPLLFQEALKSPDFLQGNPWRGLIQKLINGDYPEKLLFPVEFIVIDGKKIRDVIEMRWPCAFLISNHLKSILEENGVTGWKPYDVVIKKKDGTTLDGYSGFTVTGKNRIDPDNPDYVPDFFWLRDGWGGICCTQKVVDILKENKIKDFDIKLLAEYDPDRFNEIVFK